MNTQKLMAALVGFSFASATYSTEENNKEKRALAIEIQKQKKVQKKHPEHLARSPKSPAHNAPNLIRTRSGSANSTIESFRVLKESQHPDEEHVKHLLPQGLLED